MIFIAKESLALCFPKNFPPEKGTRLVKEGRGFLQQMAFQEFISLHLCSVSLEVKVTCRLAWEVNQ